MEHHLSTLGGALNVLVREVFDELDPQLEATALLAALPGDEDAGPSYLVTSGATTRDPEVLRPLAGADGAEPEGGSVVPGDGPAREWVAADRLRRTVEEGLRRGEGPDALQTFVGAPRGLGPYLVAPALELKAGIYQAYYALRRRQGEDGAPLASSLLDAAVTETLQAASAAISDYRPRADESTSATADEILRAAGRRLMCVPAHAAGCVDASRFFQACDLIASMRYEGGEGHGRLIVAARGHPDVEVVLEFHQPIDLEDRRGVRKVLELTGGDLCLLTDAARVFGLGRTTGAYERHAESLFEVEVLGHATWELSHADAVLMRVQNGRPRLARSEIDEDEFRGGLSRAFGHVEPRRFERLLAIAILAIHQRRGTTVVVSDGAQAEALRLGSQALRIRPVPLSPDTVPLVTGIDGAVLVDPEGVCHAIGVILDGRASRRGDPARGARFNSAVRYVDGSEHRALAIVISEEGGVDLIGPAVAARAPPAASPDTA